MKPQSSGSTISPPMTAFLLAVLALFCFGIAAMLFYCAVSPFGTSAPPPVVCWSVGGVLGLLGMGSVAGAYHYGRSAAAEPAASSKGTKRDSQAVNSPPRPEDVTGPKLQGELLSDPALQQSMGALVEALIQAAPEHYSMIHLLVEARRSNGKISILFTYGSPVLLGDYSTHVPDGVANAAFRVSDHLLRKDGSVPGIEVVLRKTGVTKWDADFHRLDEPGPQWSNLPRYPLRVCGYGLSLAPVPDTIFRWCRSESPHTITAAAAKTANSGFRNVRVAITDPGPSISPGDGVGKAEEVIQVAEGPDTDYWTIETPIFRTVWPTRLDLRYPLASKTRFDLLGSEGQLVFVQGPVSDANVLDGMAVEGQTETARGQTPAGHKWIELAYSVDRAQWRQRHYARVAGPSKIFVITAQCPHPLAQQLFEAAERVTDSLTGPAI